MKKFVIWMMVAALSATMFIGCTPKKEALLEIEGQEAGTLEEAKFFVYTMESQVGAESMSQPNPYGEGTFGDYVKEQALDTVIAINLATYIAKEKGIQPTEEELTTAKANAKSYFEQLDPEVVKNNGFTLAMFETIVTNYLYLDKLIEAETDDSEIDQAQLQSDLEMYAFQDPRYAAIVKYGPEEAAISVRAKHILLKTIDDTGAPLSEEDIVAVKAKAEEVLAKAKANEDFNSLVVEYSEDTASVPQNGELTFARGQMVTEFEDAAFSMEVGEISELVQTTYGYHIIKLEEANIAPTQEQIDANNQLVEDVTKQAKRSQKERIFEEQIEVWKTEYNIVTNEELWNAYEVTGETKPGEETEGASEVEPEASPEVTEETKTE